MTLLDTALTFGIIIAIFIIVYTKIQNQNLTDTIKELKEIISGEKKK